MIVQIETGLIDEKRIEPVRFGQSDSIFPPLFRVSQSTSLSAFKTKESVLGTLIEYRLIHHGHLNGFILIGEVVNANNSLLYKCARSYIV